MTHIGYVTIGALNSEASGKFYDALFAPLGTVRNFADGGWIGYSAAGAKETGFAACHSFVCPPHDGKEARAGNGIMLSYLAASPDAVKAAHAAGLAHGGSDEGAPGFRPPEASSGFFGAYLRDPTGNKLCLFCPVA